MNKYFYSCFHTKLCLCCYASFLVIFTCLRMIVLYYYFSYLLLHFYCKYYINVFEKIRKHLLPIRIDWNGRNQYKYFVVKSFAQFLVITINTGLYNYLRLERTVNSQTTFNVYKIPLELILCFCFRLTFNAWHCHVSQYILCGAFIYVNIQTPIFPSWPLQNTS